MYNIRHVFRSRFLVAHPVNPPLLCPLVELVPASWTNEAVMDTATAFFTEIGQVFMNAAMQSNHL